MENSAGSRHRKAEKVETVGGSPLRVTRDGARPPIPRVRAATLNIEPATLPSIDEIYDCSLTRKVTARLGQSGWQPTQ